MTVSGHVHRRRGKRGNVLYLRVRTDLSNPERVREIRLGKEWTGKGRPPAGYLTFKMAEERQREYLADAQRGLIAQVRQAATFAEAVKEWHCYQATERNRRHSTMANYRLIVGLEADGSLPDQDRGMIAHFGRDTALERISDAEIERYKAKLMQTLGARTINKRLNILGAIFKRAMRVYGLTVNPLATVERLPVRSNGDYHWLEVREVYKLAEAGADDRDVALYLTAAFTGLRMGELAGLRWQDVDYRRQLVHVRRNVVLGREGDPKSGRVRSVTLVAQAASALRSWHEKTTFGNPTDYVFASRIGTALDRFNARKRFKAALEDAGLPAMRFHDLRHTFGTLAAEAYGDLSKVMVELGHADIRTTLVYRHHVPRKADADRLSAYFSAQMETAEGEAA